MEVYVHRWEKTEINKSAIKSFCKIIDNTKKRYSMNEKKRSLSVTHKIVKN